jgi:ceramide glucosyltransferase
MHRWFLFAILLLRAQPPALAAAIGALHGVPPVLLWAVVAGALTEGAPGAWCAAAVLVWRGLCLASVQRAVYGEALHEPLLSLASELLQPLHLVHALFWRRIRWRTRRYRVWDETRFTALP